MQVNFSSLEPSTNTKHRTCIPPTAEQHLHCLPLQKPKAMSQKLKPDHKQLDQDFTEMISTLNSRLSDLQRVQKLSSISPAKDEDADENGTTIITIAGSNVGATVKGEMDAGESPDEDPAQGTYVNSNFQAVNNSIMLGGSYTSSDPGVHVQIPDALQAHAGQEKATSKTNEKTAAV